MEGFNQVYHQYYRSTFRIATKMMGQCEEVHDIVQDVFIAYYHKMQNGSVVEEPGAWLYRATLNKCVDSFRKRNIRTTQITGPEALLDEARPEGGEVKVLLQMSIARLKVVDRKLVTLYSEGFSYKEMAAITGIKYSSIGKMLSRALDRLKVELKKNGYELFD